MKKILSLLLALLLLITITCSFTGCGNKDIIDLTYKFDHAYINMGGEWKLYHVEGWTDYESDQIQVRIKDGPTILTHSMNCYLMKGVPEGLECSYCR